MSSPHLPTDPAFATPRAAYIHVPFCAYHCGYCNFTVIADRLDLAASYLAAVERELSWLGGSQEVDTVFLGGGTPTELPAADLQRLLQLVNASFSRAVSAEFSVEANPETLDAGRLALLAAAGVNRLSLGVQSLSDRKLAALDRRHRRADVLRAWSLAEEHFEDLAIDLMFAAPGERCEDWLRDLDAAIALQPAHISTYGLTIERGTRFWNERRHRRLREVDEETQREMYLAAIERLTQAGFEHYEISNFARPGRRCRHNEAYWQGRTYFGAGPGAARYVAGCRETNHRSTTTYLRRVQSGVSPTAESERLDAEQRARERLVLGLRCLEGIDANAFRSESGFEIEQLVGEQLRTFCQMGLLGWSGRRLQLTREGLLMSDSLWPELL